MNKSYVKYLLIAVVVFVWGLILVRVFKIFKDPEIFYNPNTSVNSHPKSENEIDTFTIKANYSDPFLRQTYSNNRSDDSSQSSKKRVITPVNKQEIKVIWPNIIYNGIVSNSAGNIASILETINGTNYILNKGDITNEVEIQSITPDSIMLKYRNAVKFVKRNENK